MPENFPIGLREAIQLVKNCEPENFMTLLVNDRLIKFFDSLNDAGTSALSNMNHEEALSAIEFIQIAVVLQLISLYESNPMKIMEVMSMMGSKVFERAIMLAVKSGIGLSIMEELR